VLIDLARSAEVAIEMGRFGLPITQRRARVESLSGSIELSRFYGVNEIGGTWSTWSIV
jgi:hypothetical protein